MSMCSAIRNDVEASRIGKTKIVRILGEQIGISKKEIEDLVSNTEYLDSLQENEDYIAESLKKMSKK